MGRERLEAEFPGQDVAGGRELGQGIGLPAAPVQRHHELAAEPLPQRMLTDQSGQLRHGLAVAAKGEHDVDAFLDGGQPQLVAPTKPQKSGRRDAAASGGSGGKGGGMGTVMAIVGVAASIGTTYWVIKEMHKVETPSTPTPTPQIVR